MRKIASTVLAGMLASIALTIPAHADTYQQVCVQDYDGSWFAFVIETPEDEAWIDDRRVEPFPNTAQGCSSYESTTPEPTTCEPEVVTVVKTVEVPGPVRYIETTSVQTVNNPALVRKIKRQRATIKRLRAQLRSLR